MRIRVFCAVVMVVFASNALVQADTFSWNAYTEFNSTSNDPENVWSYYYCGPEGSNDEYVLLGVWQVVPYNTFNGWCASADGFPAIGISGGELKAHPEIFAAAAIGWKSPISGVITASFSIHDADNGANGPGDHSDVPYDGVSYTLFKGGEETALASGYVANGGNSGTINVNAIPMMTGEMLYLQIGDGEYNNWYDLTGFTFTLSGNEAVWKPGDANLDGFVNQLDAERLATNWLQSDKSWGQGDFTGEGTVDDVDAALMAANWTGSSANSSVPEPSMFFLSLVGLLFLVLGKRRISC